MAATASVQYTVRVIVPYVSGTNARIANFVPSVFYGTMKDYSVTFNGELVSSGSGRGAFDTLHGVRYDSTHFSDLGIAKLKVHAENTDGKSFDDEEWQIVYNRGAIQECNDFKFPSIISEVTSALQGANHLVLSPADYDEAAFLNFCRTATGFHYGLHGSLSGLGPTRNGPIEITRQKIQDAIAKRAWRPPLNIVLAASCSTGGYGSDLPSDFGFGSNTTDRAYVGFNNQAMVGGIQGSAKIFWDALMSGKTVAEATSDAQNYYNEPMHHISAEGDFPARLNIWGDRNATLTKLYGEMDKTVWFKSF